MDSYDIFLEDYKLFISVLASFYANVDADTDNLFMDADEICMDNIQIRTWTEQIMSVLYAILRGILYQRTGNNPQTSLKLLDLPLKS